MYERAARELRVGVLNWNATTVGASSKLPFGGVKRSGNDRAGRRRFDALHDVPAGEPRSRRAGRTRVAPRLPEARVTHAVLMGDPAHFAVVGGANPHTRDKYGRKKSVDRALAIRQWIALRDLLRELDVRVEVIPPDPRIPVSVLSRERAASGTATCSCSRT